MEWLSTFHFLRPWVLLFLPIVVLLVFFAHRQIRQNNAWKQWIDPTLLKQMLVHKAGRQWLLPWWLISLPMALGVIGLAGPSWEKIPQPVIQKQNALVVVLDLSPSMNSQDIKPSRLAISRFKLIDLLKQRNEGQTGLVVYAGEAHIVTPLTDDVETLINLLPVLKPSLLPIRGSNVEAGIAQAIKLLKDSALNEGDILLLSDGVAKTAIEDIHDQLDGSGYKLSVMAVGTSDGGPIPSGQGFIKDQHGNIVIAKTDLGGLQSLADNNRGLFVTLQAGEQDLQRLNSFWENSLTMNSLENNSSDGQQSNDREFDQWLDAGHWFALALIFLFPLAFRRGGLFSLLGAVSLVAMLSTTPGQLAMAQTGNTPSQPNTDQQTTEKVTSAQSTIGRAWNGLWKTPNQQGLEAFNKQDFKRAKELFEDPQWQASADYQNGNYSEAAKAFSQGKNAADHYNLANSLAQSGDIDGALKAYDEALKLNPEHKNASYNKALVEKLKQQQQQNQDDQQSSEDNSDSDKEQDQSDSSNSDPNNSEQNSSDQNNSDQNSSNQNSADQEQNNQSDADNKEPEDQSEDQSDTQNQEGQESKQEEQDGAKGEEAQAEANENTEQQGQTEAYETQLSDEEKQALEQWLKQVPDDPSGLLRRKFLHQQRQKQIAYRNGQLKLPNNDAHKRY